VLICVFNSDSIQLCITTDVSSARHGACLALRLTTSKGILFWRASMVCYLYPTTLPYGIVVEVDIRALVEAMVRGFLSRWGDVVVDICEAVGLLVHCVSCSFG